MVRFDFTKLLQKIMWKISPNLNIAWTTLFQSRAEKNYTKLLSIQFDNLRSEVQISHSQLGQDIFALAVARNKRNGYFVEFGASDGISLSNSYLLETEYGWNGILAEPSKQWWEKLAQNRSCAISHDCVWSESNKEISINNLAENSKELKPGDYSPSSNEARTITLTDLLLENNAPSHIDFISIDTEGSEYQILSKFDFSMWHIDIIVCEHNYTNKRRKIRKMMRKNGYLRVLISRSQWDDWYVHERVLREL